MRVLLSVLVLMAGACAPARDADIAIRGVNVVDVTSWATSSMRLVDIANVGRIRAVITDGRLLRRADLDRLLGAQQSEVARR